jgi:hypothetical protein
VPSSDGSSTLVITDSNFQVLPCGKTGDRCSHYRTTPLTRFFVLFLNFVVKKLGEFWSHLRAGVDRGWICDMFSWSKEWGELFPVLEF